MAINDPGDFASAFQQAASRVEWHCFHHHVPLIDWADGDLGGKRCPQDGCTVVIVAFDTSVTQG